ncbi:Crp/Fnr family transcriptional regulator [Rhizorhapis sp. SPR117]|uniref:Crp/Fnr family transcriptional regulator n=1 Tax=Rhizorhapis sp. SPR117 TaxID=2912611 RepID=UPI001F1E2911|nr:Crp/Fnr family transcriptional regulator [Rhizorhapis sp. SPR117]
MTPCDVCEVRDYALCATLGLEREQFIRLGRQMTLPKGRTLMWEGQESMLVANVVEGALMLSTCSGDGQEQIVGVVYPSDFIGRPFGSESPHNVTALTDSRVCVFSRSVFDGFVRKHPEMEHHLLQRTLDELDRARKWMVLLGRMSAEQRVATFLVDISRRLAHVKPEGECAPLERFALPLDRQQIANVLGLTIETVSRQLSALKRDGVLALPDRRTVEIHDRKRLEAIAQAE